MMIRINSKFSFRQSFRILVSGMVLCSLYACPFGSRYQLDDHPQYAVDEAYVGTWNGVAKRFNGDEYPMSVSLGKFSDSLYAVHITGDMPELKRYRIALNDTLSGTGFMSLVADRPVMNLEVLGLNYIVELRWRKNKLSFLPLSDHFTAKYIKKNKDLRLALEWHFKTRAYPLYDADFCLKDMVRQTQEQ
jgi:hypothetical protein